MSLFGVEITTMLDRVEWMEWVYADDMTWLHINSFNLLFYLEFCKHFSLQHILLIIFFEVFSNLFICLFFTFVLFSLYLLLSLLYKTVKLYIYIHIFWFPLYTAIVFLFLVFSLVLLPSLSLSHFSLVTLLNFFLYFSWFTCFEWLMFANPNSFRDTGFVLVVVVILQPW